MEQKLCRVCLTQPKIGDNFMCEKCIIESQERKKMCASCCWKRPRIKDNFMCEKCIFKSQKREKMCELCSEQPRIWDKFMCEKCIFETQEKKHQFTGKSHSWGLLNCSAFSASAQNGHFEIPKWARKNEYQYQWDFDMNSNG